MHTRHLAFLRDGLLLADRNLARLIKDIVDTCRRFTGLVERWGGDGLPEALSTGSAETVRERLGHITEISRVSIPPFLTAFAIMHRADHLRLSMSN